MGIFQSFWHKNLVGFSNEFSKPVLFCEIRKRNITVAYEDIDSIALLRLLISQLDCYVTV